MVHSETNSTFEARVKWAIRNRQVYTYEDTVELNVSVPKVAIDDDNDDIEDLQRKYERRYRAKKEEKVREEESKKKEMEKQKMLQELLKKFPDVQLQTIEKKSNSRPPQPKQRCGVDTPVRPMKVVKVAPKSALFGDEYDEPCDRCKQKGISCHKQDPVQTSCYNCHKLRQSCSFVPTAKGIPRGGNRKRSQSLSLGSSDEEYSPIPTNPRRSTRNLGSTSNENWAELITMLNTTIREGFENLQKAIEKCADNGHLMNNQGSNKRPSTRGSSPVC